MKHINFKRVEIRNFLSIGDAPVELEFKPGLHIITGINRDKTDRRNGIGKTSLIESIYFAVFGQTIRDLKKDLIPNTYTNKTCSVVLDFDVEQSDTSKSYRITRTLNPTKLFFSENNKDITRDSIKNTEEDIHHVLSASPSIFENCVIMTLNNTTPFMAKSKVEKRKFIEGIFNLEIFGQMMSAVRDEHSDTKRVYDVELTKLETEQNTHNKLEHQRVNILNNRQEKISKYQQRKTDNIAERERLLAELGKHVIINVAEVENNIEKLKLGLIKCDQKIEQLTELKSQLQTTIHQQREMHSRIGTLEDTCSACLRPMTQHDHKHMECERASIQDNIAKLQMSLEKCVENITSTRSKKQTINQSITKTQQQLTQAQLQQQQQLNSAQRMQQIDDWLHQLDEDIVNLQSTATDVDDVIQHTNERMVQIREVVARHRQHLNLLETVKYIVSEEGVKSYIVNKILELFNNILATYLKKMDANCMCVFDEFFEESIINEKGKTCSYFNFSGAERKNIDFACLFAFMDMRRLQGDVTYNISIYDELFDSSLDEQGVKLVTDILQERVNKYNECVMIISHRKESVQHATGDVIFLEKRSGTTKRIDYNPFTTN